MGPRRALSGEPLEPLHPQVAAAQAGGEISAEHAGVITGCLERLPVRCGPAAPGIAEGMLVEAARHQDPYALARTAQVLLHRLDPDGSEPREDAAQRRRSFDLVDLGDGSIAARGSLTGETAAVWRTVLDALSAPQPRADGLPDSRSPAQRRHDALHEAGLRLLRAGTLPDAGGTPVTVLIRTTEADLANPDGVALTEHGRLLSTRQVAALAADAEVLRVGVDGRGAVLYCRRERRTASRWQRRALAARDGGCCFPGCSRPASWSEAHHVVDWIDGGPTDIDNLCLLCPYHHAHHRRLGWSVRILDGLPVWTPPPWLDPGRRPLRNTVHHPPDVDFASAGDPSLVLA